MTFTHSAALSFVGPTVPLGDNDSATSVGVNGNPDAIGVGIGGNTFYEGAIQIQPNGAFTMRGELFGQGTLRGSVTITAEVVAGPNETVRMQPFILVDGGRIDTIDSALAMASFMLDTSILFDTTGTPTLGATLLANTSVAYGADRQPVATVPGFNPLGIVANPSGSRVDIPFSVQRFPDVAAGPGTTTQIDYTAAFELTVDGQGFTEGMQIFFADPLVLNDQARRLDPSIAAPVPLPASVLFSLFGVAILAGLGHVRRRAA